ncbi:hypothetical protein [Nitrosomonas sp. Nm34]|uniref:hypothetical protein n=1 Tax=Nitrosomonas sp. Nm34 TaxID=1881055 RepID=UPI0008E30A2E|nr:hypothetical protein [Nitrosomonas sp. Nm34]SFI86661.1 hypothetical protein SAMN05428978_10498 [Nitrosomonas sp. Nm34]
MAGTSREDLFSDINFEDILVDSILISAWVICLIAFFVKVGKGANEQDRFMAANIEVELYVTLERIAAGGEEVMHVLHPVACPGCHGTGGEGGVAPQKNVKHRVALDASHIVVVRKKNTC